MSTPAAVEPNSKTILSDVFVSPVQVLTDSVEGEDGKKGPMVVRFLATRTNVLNQNMRIYPDAVMVDALTDAMMVVRAGRMIGESPHPKVLQTPAGTPIFDTKLENSVIKIVDISKVGSDVFCDAEVLETAKGRDLKALIRQKAWPGISMRALHSSVRREMNGVACDVATKLDLKSFDVVMNPATDGCGAIAVLTDSQVQELLAPLQDSLKLSCPHCGGALQSMDPDNDGDRDFLACLPCGVAFREENTLRQETAQVNVLRQLSNDNDYDGYSLAREWVEKNGKPVTDSVGGTEMALNMDELRTAMKEDPSLRAIVAELAGEIAKPALDAAEAHRVDGVRTQAKVEARALLDERYASLKDKFNEQTIGVIRDSVGEPASKEDAEMLFNSAVKFASKTNTKAALDSIGFKVDDAAAAANKGHVRVEVGEERSPWRNAVNALCDEMDRYGEQLGHTIDPKLRALNRKNIIDKVLPHAEKKIGLRALADSVNSDGHMKALFDAQGGQVLSDSVSVTTEQLLNQPTILTAVIVQSFQDTEAAQFMMNDVFAGSEWRQPIETFSSAAALNPATGLMDLAVAEGIGIAPSSINLGWQSFAPTWRRNAISLTTDVVNALRSGPVNYAAIARAIYHISEDKKRRLDLAAYLEMILSSDEYSPVLVVDETPADPDDVTATGLPGSTNAAFLYKLVPDTPDYEAPTLSGSGLAYGGNPVVRTRSVNQILPGGQIQALVTNPVTVVIDGDEQVLGVWDGSNILSFPGTTATVAVDYEHGILYMKASSGVDPDAGTPVLPTVSYSAATNYDRWHWTMGAGYTDIARWYDTFLQQLTNTQAVMGSSPRFKKPNLGIFSLLSATFVENASMFYKFASPDGSKLIDTGNTFGQRANMNLSKINAPWVAGDGRVLLSQRGSTRYGIETPYQMQGPFPVYDATQQIVDAQLWYGRENSVLCTPQVRDSDYAIMNPVSRTVIMEP